MNHNKKIKGVILAGGTGSRLYPLTKVINKHLIPVCNLPMIYYAINNLTKANISEILIITGTEHCGSIISQLGDGSDFNCNLTYKVQSKAGGIAQALSLAEDFANNLPMCVILGDNIFNFNISQYLNHYCQDQDLYNSYAELFLYSVKDPKRFGIAEIDKSTNTIINIEEKPSNPKTNYAVTGIYIFDHTVFDKIRMLKPSARGELEITDVNNMYVNQHKMLYHLIDDQKYLWSDAGTFESLTYVNNMLYKDQQNEI